MRHYININKDNEACVLSSLDLLSDKSTTVDDYRNAFVLLGKELGKLLLAEANGFPSEEIMLACASEDADWLARGVMDGLGKGNLPISIFWNTRSLIFQDNSSKLEIAPIVKSYEEPIDKCMLLIVVKSIISSSCVVKTQLNRLISKVNPAKIAILSPVIFKEGLPNLKKEFPEEISQKFNFYSFAIDEEQLPSGEVVPGIGGLVYPRLGLGDLHEKNSYIPQLVLGRL